MFCQHCALECPQAAIEKCPTNGTVNVLMFPVTLVRAAKKVLTREAIGSPATLFSLFSD